MLKCRQKSCGYITLCLQEMMNQFAITWIIALNFSHIHSTRILSAEIRDLRMHPNMSAGLANEQCYTLCPKKSDAKIQITITMAYLTRIKYPLCGFDYHLSYVNIANFNNIYRTVFEQQLF